MAWTVTIDKVEPALGNYIVTLKFVEGPTTYFMGIGVPIDLSLAEARAYLSNLRPELVRMCASTKASSAIVVGEAVN